MDDLDVLEQYLCGLTHAYDPHSDYFQPDESENFSIQAIDHSVTGIGAQLKSDDGYAIIEQVIPGRARRPRQEAQADGQDHRRWAGDEGACRRR